MYRIGIDLGGTNIVAGLVDNENRIVNKVSIKAKKNLKDTDLVLEMCNLALGLIKDNDLEEKDILSIGIGVPGSFDSESGSIILTVNLPFKNTPVREIFSKKTSIPVYLNNDANCAALGEFAAGGAKGYKNSITITLGTGVGGGIIIDEKIYSGFNDAAGELGHMVIKAGGIKCSCGRNGCLESYASASALTRETRKALKEHPESAINKLSQGNPDNINAKTAFDAMRQGDPVGKALVDQYIRDLGEGLVNYINIFQPEIILLGGGVSKEGEYLLKPLRTFINKYFYASGLIKQSKIEVAILGNDAGIIGAALLDR